MSVNKCTFMGNLGADPDIRYMSDGRAVANLSIACGERWKDKTTDEIKEHTEWIRAVVFGKRAEVIAEHFKKGSQIYIEGKMRTRKWQDNNGKDNWTTEIVVDAFEFCGQRSGGGDAKAQQQAAAYDRGAPAQSGSAHGQGNMPPPPDYDNFDDDIPF